MMSNRKTVVCIAWAMVFSAGLLARSGDTRVAEAAMDRNGAAVRTLLRQGADINGAQGDGMTALHWAAAHDDRELTALLLKGGASPAAVTRIGRYTPLHVAAKEGHGEIV